jgi:undecaprenyl-diphosphatase
MPLLNLALLALIQGITEFLPISSSGHLILFPALTGEADQGLAIDVAVHVGTLGAVVLYFRRDVAAVARGAGLWLRGRREAPEARLALLLGLATLPLIAVGALAALTGLDAAFRSVAVIGWTTLLWGAALGLADRFGPRRRVFSDWRLPDAVVMGLAQALAIVPGTSRSGITMTAARLLGFERVDAARLSLLMSIPAILAAGGWLGLDLLRSGDLALGRDAALAAALAFVSALVAVAALMRMLAVWTMTPFVIYRLVLGVALLWIAYG